jgi:PAT family beta-lactamase induction signal transducer AmpG
MTPDRPAPPFLFAILILPFGAAIGFLQVAAPYWLRQDGLPLSEIAVVSASGFLPHAWKILWVPLIDVVGTRRGWYLTMTALTALALAAVSLVPDRAHHLGLFTALITLAQATAATASAAGDALMAITTRPEDKGRAGGFWMAGTIGGTGLLGALAIWLSSHATPTMTGLVLAAIVLGAGAWGLLLDEPHRRIEDAPVDTVLGRVGHVLRDLLATVKTREGVTGLLICAAPVGCGAMTNLFAGIAADYHASESVVQLVNGPGCGLVAALGSILGGYLADRVGRRQIYVLAGGLTALAGLAMWAGPMNGWTYAGGTLAYSFANGIAFAALAGMILEMVGHGPAVATKYALFVAVSNQAISYVTYLDGRATTFRGWGPRGALAFDAFITAAGIAFLLLPWFRLRRLQPASIAVS